MPVISAFEKWIQEDLKLKVIFNYNMCSQAAHDTYLRPNQNDEIMPEGQSYQMKLTHLLEEQGKAFLSYPSLSALYSGFVEDTEILVSPR